MLRRTLLAKGARLGLAALVSDLAGCVRVAHEQLVVPELEPIDPTRPYVRYRPIQGVSHGAGGLLEALLDMQRLTGVDGYVQVTMDQYGRGDHMVTVVTGYPITYGALPKAISIRVGPPIYADPAAPPTARLDEDPGATVAERISNRRRRGRPAEPRVSTPSGPR
jgi:hypothetical protein